MVLVDTSVWVGHLRDGHEGLRALLDEGLVVCHPFIIGELACGNLANRAEILSLLRALPQTDVATHDEVLTFIDARELAGKGLGYIDVHLLAAAAVTGVPLWTQDRRLKQAALELRSGYEEVPAATGNDAPASPPLLTGGNPQIAKGEGDAPVQAYIAAMPGWKSDIGRRLDALVVQTVPGVRKAIKWNSPFYGIEGQGWFLSFHTFTHYVKVTFFKGTELNPVPPGGTSEVGRWIDIHEDDLDEAQMAEWIRQAAALPGWGTS